MSELQKLAELNDVALGSAVGGGVGAAGGLLATLFRSKPSLKQGLIDMLIGGAGGAAIGGGATALSELVNKPEPTTKPEAPAAPTAPTKPEAPAKSMRTGRAALSGLAPIVGPAVDGYQGGGAEQALRSAGRSSLEALGGSSLGLGLHLLAAKKGINIPMWQAQAAGALAGSAHGAYAAAANFNERQKAAAAQDVGRKIDTAAANIGGLNISPLSGMGGAVAGGAVGAALGGGAGLLKALFDSEDDGLVSTLSKALSGGALGGLAGAGVGAVGANYLRKGVLDRLPYAGAPGSSRNQVTNETLKRFVTPVSSLFNRATGRIDKRQFNQEVTDANTQEATMHAIAPLLLSSASRNNQR